MLNKIKDEINEKVQKSLDEFKKSSGDTVTAERVNEMIDPRWQQWKDNITSQSIAIDSINSHLSVRNPQFEKLIKDLQESSSTHGQAIKGINEKSSHFISKKDMDKIQNDILNKLEDETKNINSEANIQKANISNIREQLNLLLDDKSDHNDIQIIKGKIESANAAVNNLKIYQNEIEKLINSRPYFDPSKYIDIISFGNYKMEVVREFASLQDEAAEIKTQVQNIILNLLGNKASWKDLKTWEDDVMAKLEDWKIGCIKKYPDKTEVSKNFKYIDQQIKHIIETYTKRMDKSDSWLLAKKPVGGHWCASCETYLGDLKDGVTQYVPWNKYPVRDPSDKLYRIGTGFSKMLQMVNLENKGLNKNNSVSNLQTFNEVYGNEGEREDAHERDHSAPKETGCENNIKSWPMINKANRIVSQSNEFGKDEIVGDVIEIKEEQTKNNPKIMKIYKKAKE